MTELDQLRKENPLTNLDTVLWAGLENEDGYETLNLDWQSRMLVLDTSVVKKYIKPDLNHFYDFLNEEITEDEYENRALEFIPPLLELIPYGVPATGLYEMVDTVMEPGMKNHTAIIAVIQGYTCCMAGWLSEDQRYERLKPRPLKTRELPQVEPRLVADQLAETFPEIDSVSKGDGKHGG